MSTSKTPTLFAPGASSQPLYASGRTDRLPDIDDACFRVPIPVGALVDRVLADDTVARALLAANNSVLEGAMRQQRAQGIEQGLGQGLEQGRFTTLVGLFSRRLRRPLTQVEQGSPSQRLAAYGSDRHDSTISVISARVPRRIGGPR